MSEILFDKAKDKEIVLSDTPTAEDMAKVAARHTPEEWAKLTASHNFMLLLMKNIPKAKMLAEKILAGKGDTLTKAMQ